MKKVFMLNQTKIMLFLLISMCTNLLAQDEKQYTEKELLRIEKINENEIKIKSFINTNKNLFKLNEETINSIKIKPLMEKSYINRKRIRRCN